VANQALTDYIAAARAKGHEDGRIKKDLTAAGWNTKMVTAALTGDDDLPVPPPPPPGASSDAPAPPRSVVQTFSTRGLEYIIMFIALGVSALSLGSLLHASVNALFGSAEGFLTGSGSVSFATSALIVSFPVLAVLFLRLKKLELSDPILLSDPSRKRAVQLTLVVTFLIGLGNVIYFVYSLMSGSSNDAYNVVGSQAASTVMGNFVHLVITLGIAGGIFAYYWRDEHRQD
jgi:hypothetical protein